MPGPHSYTGEDVAEIHVHGGDFAPVRALNAVLDRGARMAEPGEFTKRAFLNGKIDLTQAEAVMDLIQAKTASAGKLAEKQMAGRLGSKIRKIRISLIGALAEIESRLDFPDEDLDFVVPEELTAVLSSAEREIENLLKSGRSGRILRNGVRLVLAGSPNAGKSSLLNALLGFDRAIVTEVPGTTRDTLEENLTIHGILCKITDTAGLRENSSDLVEGMGIVRTKESIQSAEIVLWLLDASRPDSYKEDLDRLKRELPEGMPCIVCWNKTDLLSDRQLADLPEVPNSLNSVKISALNGTGLNELSDQIEQLVWRRADHSESDCAIAERHEKLLKEAAVRLEQAESEIKRLAWELAASCLHEAVFSLGTITGENVQPDILDEIFSRFCIGK